MGTGFDVMSLLPFVLIFGVFYFLILRPQQQKMKKHQNMLANLRRGDRVVTNGGLIGVISKIVSDNEVQLELDNDVRVRHVRGMITEVLAKTDPVTASNTPAPANTKNTSAIVKKAASPKAKKTRGASTKATSGKAKK